MRTFNLQCAMLFLFLRLEEPREHKPFLENFLFVLTWLQSLKTFLAEINPGWLNRLQDGSRSTEAHSYGKNLR